MGAAASITQDEAASYPQYQMLGGSAKFSELKDAEGKVTLDMVQDPYLLYGGSYENDPKDTIGFKFVKFNKIPNFTSEHSSALASILTANLFDKLKSFETTKGYSLSNAIQPGVVTPNLDIGVSAGDEESYELFEELYYPIIKFVHGYDPVSQEQSHSLGDGLPSLSLTPDQSNLLSQVVSSFKIRGQRNISGLSFSTGTNAEDRETVEEIFKGFANAQLQGKYYSLGQMSEEDVAMLTGKEYYMHAPKPNDFITAAGGARSWPKNRGVFVNQEDNLLVWVNHEDNIRFEILDKNGCDIATSFQSYVAFHKNLEQYLTSIGKKFAWTSNLGFIGSNFSSIGTAMTVSVTVSLPNLVNSVDLLKDIASSLKMIVTKVDGNKAELSSKKCLGATESNIIESFMVDVCRVVTIENEISSGSSVETIRNQLVTAGQIINPKSSKSPTTINVTSPKYKGSSIPKIVVVASSPKNVVNSPKLVVVAPTSPKGNGNGSPQKVKSPVNLNEVAQDSFLQKSPSKENVVPAKMEMSSIQRQPSLNAFNAPRPSFMSGKFAKNLKIEIDELKFPGEA